MSVFIKTISLTVLFIIIFIINSLLIVSFYSNSKKIARQKQIFAEIDLMSIQNTSFSSNHPPMILGVIEPQINPSDARIINLQKFLAKYNSPLYNYADKIVYYSDQNNLDYRILVAIAGQESTFCKFIPHNSYNCWGWGVFGDNVINFENYEDGIKTVAEGLKHNYVDKGLVTSEDIMAKYTPSSNTWASAIRKFFHGIEEP